jgi:hypothetical protein
VPDDTEDLVGAVVVAAVELPYATVLMVIGPVALGPFLLGPAAAADRVDGEGAELVEGEDPVGVLGHHLLDAVELSLLVGVVGLLPGLGPLEGDVVLREDLPQALPADHDAPGRVAGQVVGELAHAPASEGPPQLLRAGLGRLDDIGLVVRADPAGTATRPLGVQAGHAHLVEVVDDLSYPVL